MGCFCSSEPLTNVRARQSQSHYNFEMHDINTLNYVPEDAVAVVRDPQRLVTKVHFVALLALDTGGNHWNIILETGKQSSVGLDISPGAYPGREGYIGRLDIIHNSFDGTRHSHQLVTIPSTPGHCVADYLDAITAADNHRYEFNREGRGCTGWVRDQFYLFVKTGLLPAGLEQHAEHAISSAWVEGVSQGPWPVTRGRYLRDKKGKGGKTANIS